MDGMIIALNCFSDIDCKYFSLHIFSLNSSSRSSTSESSSLQQPIMLPMQVWGLYKDCWHHFYLQVLLQQALVSIDSESCQKWFSSLLSSYVLPLQSKKTWGQLISFFCMWKWIFDGFREDSPRLSTDQSSAHSLAQSSNHSLISQ